MHSASGNTLDNWQSQVSKKSWKWSRSKTGDAPVDEKNHGAAAMRTFNLFQSVSMFQFLKWVIFFCIQLFFLVIFPQTTFGVYQQFGDSQNCFWWCLSVFVSKSSPKSDGNHDLPTYGGNKSRVLSLVSCWRSSSMTPRRQCWNCLNCWWRPFGSMAVDGSPSNILPTKLMHFEVSIFCSGSRLWIATALGFTNATV